MILHVVRKEKCFSLSIVVVMLYCRKIKAKTTPNYSQTARTSLKAKKQKFQQ